MINNSVADRLTQFPEYPFAALARKKMEIEKREKCVVLDLSIGSPTFSPSALYKQKLKEYIDYPGSHLYPGYGATPQFSNGLISWYSSRFNSDLNQDELFPLLGAKDGVSHIPMALANSGDEILVPNPGYPGFTGPALMMGINVIPYDLLEEEQFKISLNEIKKKISPKTRMIWINFPSNPTGQVASVEELEPIVAFCIKRNIWLVYDNAYADIAYGGFLPPSILEVPGAKNCAVEIGSFSKMYSFAGYRIGWIVGNKNAIAAIAKIKSQLDSGLSLPLQNLAAYAFMHPDNAWHNSMIGSYEQNKKKVTELLVANSLTVTNPAGALYLWAKIPHSSVNSAQFAEEFLEKKHILVTPGAAFGTNGERYIRACFSGDISLLSEYL